VLSHVRQQQQTLLQCHDNPVSTGHARRRSEAVANLEPYIDRMANQYNKSSKVHWFEVGQHVGLKIPSEVREKMDPRFVVCMVISRKKKRKRKDYTFRRQFNEKPSIIPGCPGSSVNSALMVTNYAVSMVWCKGSSALTS